MPAIQITAFSGALPAVSSRLLPNENATTAHNTLLEDGDLKPMEGALINPVQPQLPAFVRTLYKYNNQFFAKCRCQIFFQIHSFASCFLLGSVFPL